MEGESRVATVVGGCVSIVQENVLGLRSTCPKESVAITCTSSHKAEQNTYIRTCMHTYIHKYIRSVALNGDCVQILVFLVFVCGCLTTPWWHARMPNEPAANDRRLAEH
jgi:hypothetical protein